MLRKYMPDPSMLPLAWATAESFWKDWEPAHQSLIGISSEVQRIQGKAYSWYALVPTHPSSLLPYPCYKPLGLINWAPLWPSQLTHFTSLSSLVLPMTNTPLVRRPFPNSQLRSAVTASPDSTSHCAPQNLFHRINKHAYGLALFNEHFLCQPPLNVALPI